MEVILVLFLLLSRGLVINIINVYILGENDFWKYLLCYNGVYWENNKKLVVEFVEMVENKGIILF